MFFFVTDETPPLNYYAVPLYRCAVEVSCMLLFMGPLRKAPSYSRGPAVRGCGVPEQYDRLMGGSRRIHSELSLQFHNSPIAPSDFDRLI